MDIKTALSPSEGTCRELHRHGRIDPLFQSPEPLRALGIIVTFEPGARMGSGRLRDVTESLHWGDPGPARDLGNVYAQPRRHPLGQ